MNILLSIAIPVYNGAMTIGDTLDSIVSQLEPSVEIVISDNASTDQTPAIIEKYQEIYPAIKYFRNEINMGADANIDLVVHRSNGDYVWIMGDDDEIVIGGVSSVLRVIETHHDLAAIFVNYGLYDRNSGLCCQERVLNVQEDVYCKNSDIFLNLVTVYPNFLSSNIVLRALWLKSDSKKYVGTHWLQFGMLMSIIPGYSAFCISTPYVLNKGIEYNGPNEANRGGVAVAILLNLVDIISSLPVDYYSKASIDKAIMQAYKFLPRKILSSRRNGLLLSRSVFSRLHRHFSHLTLFWVRDIPLLLLPKIFHLFAWKLYKLPLVNIFYWKIKSRL